jgi:hypothetical protein
MKRARSQDPGTFNETDAFVDDMQTFLDSLPASAGKRSKVETEDHIGANSLLGADSVIAEMQDLLDSLSVTCADTRPNLSVILRNFPDLRDFTCADIVSLTESWDDDETNIGQSPQFNPQQKQLLRHFTALFKLENEKNDPSSITNFIIRPDEQELESMGLEIYDVVTIIKEYDETLSPKQNIVLFLGKIGLDLSTWDVNRYFPTGIPAYNSGSVNTDQFNPRQKRIIEKFMSILIETETLHPVVHLPPAPKNWHRGRTDFDAKLAQFPLNTQFFGAAEVQDHKGLLVYTDKTSKPEDILQTLEKDLFRMVITAQQLADPQTINSEIAHTAVVVVTTHGEIRCRNPHDVTLPSYLIPDGKTLTIISIATPTVVNVDYVDPTKTMDFINILRKHVSACNLRNDFIHPLEFSELYLNYVRDTKRVFRQKTFDKSLIFEEKDKKHIERFTQNYVDPRIVVFNENDYCIDKTLTEYNTRKDQIIKFNFVGWDQELMRPQTEVQLSEVCNYLFQIEGHKNVVLFDTSCSVLSGDPFGPAQERDISEDAGNLVGRQALNYGLNGGARSNRR